MWESCGRGGLWGGGAVEVKHFECHFMSPPQEIQCMHMYSVSGT